MEDESSSSTRRSGRSYREGSVQTNSASVGISERNCHCDIPWVQRTAWTELKPGRRFRNCYKVRCSKLPWNGACFFLLNPAWTKFTFSVDNWFIFAEKWRLQFFVWINPEMCRRSKEVIPGLIRRISEERNENERLRNENESLRIENARIRGINQEVNELGDFNKDTRNSENQRNFGCFRLFLVMVVVCILMYWY